MSALRLAPGVYRDPWTGAAMAPGIPVELPPSWTPPPVIRRHLSPAELAAVRARDGGTVGLRPIRGMLSDAERARRLAARKPQHGADASRRRAQERLPDAVVGEAVTRCGSLPAAAVSLGIPYTTAARRYRRWRARVGV